MTREGARATPILHAWPIHLLRGLGVGSWGLNLFFAHPHSFAEPVRPARQLAELQRVLARARPRRLRSCRSARRRAQSTTRFANAAASTVLAAADRRAAPAGFRDCWRHRARTD